MYGILAGILTIISVMFLLIIFGTGGGGDHPFIAWILFIASSIGAWYCYAMQKEIQAEAMRHKSLQANDRLKSTPNYTSTQRYASHNGEVTLSIDEKSKQITIITLNSFRNKVYSYRDILKSEILTDGVSIASANRGSQLGGALLGGFLAGGVGAMIGGLSGSSTIEEKVNKVELNVIVNDTATPIYKIAFLDAPFPIAKSTKEYKDAYNLAYHCHQLIGVLIRQADEEDKRKELSIINNNSQNNISVADELRKLVQLKEEGIINEDEFEVQKKKLIG